MPRSPVQHEYVAIREDYGPPLPRLNRAVLNVYLSLPASKSSVTYSNNHQATVYATKTLQATVYSPMGPVPAKEHQAAKNQWATVYPTTEHVPRTTGIATKAMPPPADSRATLAAASGKRLLAAANLVALPPPRSTVLHGPPDDLIPKGPIGDTMRHLL